MRFHRLLLPLLLIAVPALAQERDLRSFLGIAIGDSPSQVRQVMEHMPGVKPESDRMRGAGMVLSYSGGRIGTCVLPLCAIESWIFSFLDGRLAVMSVRLGVEVVPAGELLPGYRAVIDTLIRMEGKPQASLEPAAVPGWRSDLGDTAIVAAMAASRRWLYAIWAVREGDGGRMLECRLDRDHIDITFQDPKTGTLLMEMMRTK